ncbi:MAG: hypothetical protein J6B87_03165, partial [Clostridia bacterium]|nr:hypothetical protein [Clostridia bacterium]
MFKTKSKHLISILMMLTMIMISSVCLAADSRTVVSNVVGTVEFEPEYGDTYEDEYTFTITEGTQAHVSNSMGSWLKKSGEEWNEYNDTIFTEGTYKYQNQLRIDGSYGITHKLAENLEVSFNGEEWVVEDVYVFDTYSYAFITSPEITLEVVAIELKFDHTNSYNISDNYVGRALTSYSVADGVIGGTSPYVFSKTSGPAWISVSEAGIISGTPIMIGENEDLVVRVTDSADAYKEITITVEDTSMNPNDRTEVSSVVGTIADFVPEYGDTYEDEYTFTITEGTQAHVSNSMGSWLKKSGEEWNQYDDANFTEGTYKYQNQLRIDGSYGTTHKLAENLEVNFNGEEWVVEDVYVFDTYSYAMIQSPEIVVTNTTTYLITIIGYDITNTSIAGGKLYLETDKGLGQDNGTLNVVGYATNNTNVEINAEAVDGYEFVEWRLSGPTGSTVTTNANHTFKATEQLYLYAIFQEESVQPTIPTGSIIAPTFDPQTVGYTPLGFKYLTVELTNNVQIDPENAMVELTGTNQDAFEFAMEGKGLMTGIGSWADWIKVKPIHNLAVGTYNAIITLKYDVDGDKEEYETTIGSANLTFTVEEAQPITAIDVTCPGYIIGGNIANAVPTTATQGVTITYYEWQENDNGSKLESGTFAADTQYRLAVYLKVNDGYTAENLEKANVKIDGKETSHFTNPCLGNDAQIGDMKIYHYPDMLSQKYTVTYDLNGGTAGTNYVESYQVNIGDTWEIEAPPEVFVIAPTGKEIDAIEANGVRYEIGDEYTYVEDVTIKILWKDIVVTTTTYTITWVDEDGQTELEKDENVVVGTMPSYDGSEPTKAEDAENTYTFAGWTPEVVAVTGDATYTATYNTVPKAKYTVTWVDEDGQTELEKDENVVVGTMPSYDGSEPTKA